MAWLERVLILAVALGLVACDRGDRSGSANETPSTSDGWQSLLADDGPRLPDALDGSAFGMSREALDENGIEFPDGRFSVADLDLAGGVARLELDATDRLTRVSLSMPASATDVRAYLEARWGEPSLASDQETRWTSDDQATMATIKTRRDSHPSGREPRWTIVHFEPFVDVASLFGARPAPPAAFGGLELGVDTRAEVVEAFPELASWPPLRWRVPTVHGARLDFRFGEPPDEVLTAFVVDPARTVQVDPRPALTQRWGEPEMQLDPFGQPSWRWTAASEDDPGVAYTVTLGEQDLADGRLLITRGRTGSVTDLLPDRPGIPAAFGSIALGTPRAELATMRPPELVDGRFASHPGLRLEERVDSLTGRVTGFVISGDVASAEATRWELRTRYGDPTVESDGLDTRYLEIWCAADGPWCLGLGAPGGQRAVGAPTLLPTEPADGRWNLVAFPHASVTDFVDLESGTLFDGTPFPAGESLTAVEQRLGHLGVTSDTGLAPLLSVPAVSATAAPHLPRGGIAMRPRLVFATEDGDERLTGLSLVVPLASPDLAQTAADAFAARHGPPAVTADGYWRFEVGDYHATLRASEDLLRLSYDLVHVPSASRTLVPNP